LLSGLYISLSAPCHKKIADQASPSFAHDSGDGDGEEASREQEAGCAVGALGQDERRRQKSPECDANGGKT
jgi:hypothetical protein